MMDDDDMAFKRYTTIRLMGQAAELTKLNKAIVRRNAKIARLMSALKATDETD